MIGTDRSVPPAVRAHWRLGDSTLLAAQDVTTWRVVRGGHPFVLKHFGAAALPGWQYQLRVAAALRRAGWPAPEVADEPLSRPEGAWVLLHWLPGEPSDTTDRRTEELARGRLLARFHETAGTLGIDDQRTGFTAPYAVVDDPELEHWLRIHEAAVPSEGAILRRYRAAAAERLAGHHPPQARASVIHGDFTSWNLLFEDGRLSGLLDLEITHRSLQVADFALSWRGNHDDVIRGYDEVRPLSPAEWQLILPVFWSWLFLGVKDLLAGHYDAGRPARLDLTWHTTHLLRESELMRDKLGDDCHPQ